MDYDSKTLDKFIKKEPLADSDSDREERQSIATQPPAESCCAEENSMATSVDDEPRADDSRTGEQDIVAFAEERPLQFSVRLPAGGGYLYFDTQMSNNYGLYQKGQWPENVWYEELEDEKSREEQRWKMHQAQHEVNVMTKDIGDVAGNLSDFEEALRKKKIADNDGTHHAAMDNTYNDLKAKVMEAASGLLSDIESHAERWCLDLKHLVISMHRANEKQSDENWQQRKVEDDCGTKDLLNSEIKQFKLELGPKNFLERGVNGVILNYSDLLNEKGFDELSNKINGLAGKMKWRSSKEMEVTDRSNIEPIVVAIVASLGDIANVYMTKDENDYPHKALTLDEILNVTHKLAIMAINVIYLCDKLSVNEAYWKFQELQSRAARDAEDNTWMEGNTNNSEVQMHELLMNTFYPERFGG